MVEVPVLPDTLAPELEPPAETPAEVPLEVVTLLEDETPDVEPDTEAPADVPSELVTLVEDETPDVEPDTETPVELPFGVVKPTDEVAPELELLKEALRPVPPAPVCTLTVVAAPPVPEERLEPSPPVLVLADGDTRLPVSGRLRLGTSGPNCWIGPAPAAEGFETPMGIELCDVFAGRPWTLFGFAVAVAVAPCALPFRRTRPAALALPTGLSSRLAVRDCRALEAPGSKELKACSTALGSGTVTPLSASSGIGTKATSSTSSRSRAPIPAA